MPKRNIIEGRTIKGKRPKTIRVRVAGSETDDPITSSFRNSVKISVEHSQSRGVSVARYDVKAKKAYLEYPDGKREYQ